MCLLWLSNNCFEYTFWSYVREDDSEKFFKCKPIKSINFVFEINICSIFNHLSFTFWLEGVSQERVLTWGSDSAHMFIKGLEKVTLVFEQTESVEEKQSNHTRLSYNLNNDRL